jgi:hypothetical protein
LLISGESFIEIAHERIIGIVVLIADKLAKPPKHLPVNFVHSSSPSAL